jgi:crossover junction endodeoxyribonuclease RuvC
MACLRQCMSTQQIILGIDPGTNSTGYGVISSYQGTERLVTVGEIKTKGAIENKLAIIHQELTQIIAQHQPNVFAIESVFVNKNVNSALKLGQARGVAICACAQAGLCMHEYAPREIKQATVGYGSANKEQIQHMVKQILGIKTALGLDASDALAIALTHAQHQRWQVALNKSELSIK